MNRVRILIILMRRQSINARCGGKRCDIQKAGGGGGDGKAQELDLGGGGFLAYAINRKY